MENLGLALEAKRVAASAAARIILDEYSDARVVGVGTGSTVSLVLEELASMDRSFFESRYFLASSIDTLLKLQRLGARAALGVAAYTPEVYFDGADEVVVTRGCPALKGRGAALYLEKLLATYSGAAILVVDESKVSRRLGERGRPLPVDVDPLALAGVTGRLSELGASFELRSGTGKDGPVVSDAGGVIIDVRVEPDAVERIAREIEGLPGVRATGYFSNLFTRLIVGYGDGRILYYDCTTGSVIPRRS